MLGLVFGWLILDEVVLCAEAEVTSIKINASDVILIFICFPNPAGDSRSALNARDSLDTHQGLQLSEANLSLVAGAERRRDVDLHLLDRAAIGEWPFISFAYR